VLTRLRADRQLDVAEVFTDFQQVTDLNNRYFAPVWRRLTAPDDTFVWSSSEPAFWHPGNPRASARGAPAFSRTTSGAPSTATWGSRPSRAARPHRPRRGGKRWPVT
jgi:hypothetical protein